MGECDNMEPIEKSIRVGQARIQGEGDSYEKSKFARPTDSAETFDRPIITSEMLRSEPTSEFHRRREVSRRIFPSWGFPFFKHQGPENR